jgi:hypothetical protein
MTPMQIEGMVDRICGLFPTTIIGRNTVKNAWVADDFLLDADVDEARKVTDWIKANSDKFPASLKEVHNIFRKVRGLHAKYKPMEMECDICNGTLWDDGIRYSNSGVRLSEQYEVEVLGHTYKVVRPCPNCRGSDWQFPER